MRQFRNLVIYLAASVSIALSAGAALAADNFRIGGVVALSGPYGILGEDMRKGVELALSQRPTVLGQRIEVVWEDTESKPQVAVQKATKAASAGAQLLFGAVGSGETVAIMELARQRKLPLLVTASADDIITGEKGNRYTFRTINKLGSEIVMMRRFIEQEKIAAVYGVAADVGIFRDGWGSIKSGLQTSGVAVKGEDIVPLGTKDYSVVINKVAESGATMVVLMMGGADGITFVKQAAEVKLKDKVRIAGPVLMDEVAAKAAGAASLGVISGVRYHFSLDTAANQAFVADYRKMYAGEWPGYLAGEAYDGLNWMLDVIESTRSTDPETWIAAFERSERTNSLEGTKKMRACDHQAEQRNYLAEVVSGASPMPALMLKIIGSWSDAELGMKPCP